MVSLCYRSLASYITDDNLAGLQSFLENKRVQVDDRDEVSMKPLIAQKDFQRLFDHYQKFQNNKVIIDINRKHKTKVSLRKKFEEETDIKIIFNYIIFII